MINNFNAKIIKLEFREVENEEPLVWRTNTSKEDDPEHGILNGY